MAQQENISLYGPNENDITVTTFYSKIVNVEFPSI